MYAQVRWTSFRFDKPVTVSEEFYSAAKGFPSEFRRGFVNAHLLAAAKGPAVAFGLMVLICVALFVAASFCDFSDRNQSSYTVGSVCVTVGTVGCFSGFLTAASFVGYAVSWKWFWVRVQSAARKSDSYADFIARLRKRRLIIG